MFRRPTFCAITLASLAVALLQGVNTASAGPLTFDHFTSPGSTVQILGIAAGGGTPSATVSNLQTGVGGLTFGTWREITIQRTGGSGLANSDINTSVASHWAVSNGPLTGSFSTVRYDFAAQGFNLDFSGTGSIDLGGIDLDGLCAMFDGKEKVTCKSLCSWVHDGSHYAHDDLYVSIGDTMVDTYLRVFRKIFEKQEHHAHYKMMMGDDYVESPPMDATV